MHWARYTLISGYLISQPVLFISLLYQCGKAAVKLDTVQSKFPSNGISACSIDRSYEGWFDPSLTGEP